MDETHAQMNISWTSPNIGLGSTRGYGNGVFAKNNIRKDEDVAVFGGYVVAIKDLPSIRKQMKDAYDIVLQTGYQITDELIFSPISKDQFSTIEYLNHSCDPNCGFKSQLELVAMRNIQKGEEITIDYAMCITSDIFSLEKCLCDTIRCRQRVSGDDWMDNVLQKRYEGYFQPYIEEKIKKSVQK